MTDVINSGGDAAGAPPADGASHPAGGPGLPTVRWVDDGWMHGDGKA